jgi:hypothetical protein
MLLTFCQYIHLSRNRQFYRFFLKIGSNMRFPSFLVVLSFQKMFQTTPGCFLGGGLFFFQGQILKIDGARSSLRLSFARVTAANRKVSHTKRSFWNQLLNGFPVTYGANFFFMQPRMARRKILDMGAFCNLDSPWVQVEIRIGISKCDRWASNGPNGPNRPNVDFWVCEAGRGQMVGTLGFSFCPKNVLKHYLCTQK